MKIIRAVPFVTTIMLMVMIFMFSSQTALESSEISAGLTEKIINSIPVIKNMSPEKKQEIVDGIHNAVRKCSHFAIYAALGFSAAAMFLSIRPEKRMLYIWLYAVLFSCIYAGTDEFHQLFVSGRGGQIRDVFIDTAGAVMGGGFFVLIKKLYTRIKLLEK